MARGNPKSMFIDPRNIGFVASARLGEDRELGCLLPPSEDLVPTEQPDLKDGGAEQVEGARIHQPCCQ